MIAVLLPARARPDQLPECGRLRRTNPHICPSWRNGQTFDSEQPLLVANRFSVSIEILEVLSFRLSRVTGTVIAYVLQPASSAAPQQLLRDRTVSSLCRSVPFALEAPLKKSINSATRVLERLPRPPYPFGFHSFNLLLCATL